MKSLQALAKDRRIASVWDEGDDGYWATLKPGYQWDGVHGLHERTIANLRRRLAEVRTCACSDCSPKGGAQ